MVQNPFYEQNLLFFFISTDFLKLQLTESVLICFGLVKNYRGALEEDRGGLFSLSQVLFTGPV